MIGKHHLKNLTELAAGTSRYFRGWLGNFSSEQNVLIYRIFEDYHTNPWERVIDPLWKAIIEHVEDAWLLSRSATVFDHPEIIRHVEAAWCTGYACQEMDPSAERTFYSGRDASQNTPPTGGTRVSSVRFVQRALSKPLHPLSECHDGRPSVASGDLTTLTYWWMCPNTIHLLFSRLLARVRKRRFSSSPRAR